MAARDFLTMREEVAALVGAAPLDAGPFEAGINLAIIQAIQQLRHRPFPWNEAELAITPLVVDQLKYTPAGLTLATTLNGATETAVVVNESIPTGLAATGTVYIRLDTGEVQEQAYTSWTGSTFTIASTDFTTSPAASGNKVGTAADLPHDFLYLWQQLMWCEDTSASVLTEWEMIYLSYADYQVQRRTGGTASGDSGKPLYYTFTGQDLRIYPAADATTYKLTGIYLKKIPPPEKTVSAGTFSFSADTFTNAWFDEGYEIVKLGAAAVFSMGKLKNNELAQSFRAQQQAEMQALVITEERVRAPRIARGWFGAEGVLR